MVPDRSKNWSRPAEIQSWYAGAAGPFSYCDARSPISQSTDCGLESFIGHVHWQCPQRRRDDVSDDAGVYQGAEVVALAKAGCAEKRTFERHTPCLRALRVIGCNLLEIYVTYEHSANSSVSPSSRKQHHPHSPQEQT